MKWPSLLMWTSMQLLWIRILRITTVMPLDGGPSKIATFNHPTLYDALGQNCSMVLGVYRRSLRTSSIIRRRDNANPAKALVVSHTGTQKLFLILWYLMDNVAPNAINSRYKSLHSYLAQQFDNWFSNPSRNNEKAQDEDIEKGSGSAGYDNRIGLANPWPSVCAMPPGAPREPDSPELRRLRLLRLEIWAFETRTGELHRSCREELHDLHRQIMAPRRGARSAV
ncbi:TPA_exp: hypothetical protein A8136_3960 [Trichophyton benhamiae CBS 112371]|nr:TPA_exp: hypothetical protein A8136_3960 [Trichophyton benhamiae CBS 112371]